MIDLYCERTDPGLWAEPLNALTNLAYFAAAWAVWRSGRDTADPGMRVLIGLLVAIGAGSGLFHTLATPWTRVLDVTPILLFQLSFVWLYGRRFMDIAAAPLAGMVGVFLAVALAGRQFPQLLNGSLSYAPAFWSQPESGCITTGRNRTSGSPFQQLSDSSRLPSCAGRWTTPSAHRCRLAPISSGIC
jgi:hypothetical protein